MAKKKTVKKAKKKMKFKDFATTKNHGLVAYHSCAAKAGCGKKAQKTRRKLTRERSKDRDLRIKKLLEEGLRMKL